MAGSGSPVPSVDFLQLPLGAIAEAAHCAIVLVEAEQSIVAINEAAARTFGCMASAILGQPLSSLVPESRRAAQEARVEAFEFAGLQERGLLAQAFPRRPRRLPVCRRFR